MGKKKNRIDTVHPSIENRQIIEHLRAEELREAKKNQPPKGQKPDARYRKVWLIYKYDSIKKNYVQTSKNITYQSKDVAEQQLSLLMSTSKDIYKIISFKSKTDVRALISEKNVKIRGNEIEFL